MSLLIDMKKGSDKVYRLREVYEYEEPKASNQETHINEVLEGINTVFDFAFRKH